MPSSVSLKQLLETGVHFGHRKQKWNPKMEPYIFTQRNGIHILDLQQTLVNLNKYYDRVRDLVANGGKVLFVGTKRQAQETIAREADRCRMPYVNQRWLGGTLTNWSTIYDRIKTLEKLEGRRDRGELELLTKRERVMINRQIEKLQIRLGGIRTMKKLPQMVIVVDTVRENTAVREANKLAIPVLALVDSNSDPDEIDYIIPSNDDAMRSINLIVHTLAEAVIEGQNMRASFKDDDGEEEYEDMSQVNLDRYDDTDEDGDDEEYLGEATLAKLRDSKLFDEEDEDEEDDE
jgi:small subunit ribosomal protein S2